MIIDILGKEIDCTLVRMAIDDDGNPYKSDNRNIPVCKRKMFDCAKCMWNAEYDAKHSPELSLQPMSRKEIRELKRNNTIYPIKATSLRCMKVKRGNANV